MKRKSLLFSLVALIVSVMAIFLSACSTYGSIKSDFEDAGFVEDTNITAYQEQINKALGITDGEDANAICTIHLLKKEGLLEPGIAVIFEFNSTEEMEKKISESETLKGLIKDMQKSEYVNGNCILFIHVTSEVKDIFKNA